jgi:Protein of unknown function (DUF995)
MRAALFATFAIVLASAPAMSAPLPKTATPMTSDELSAIYSGKTAVWKMSSVYFAPNHSARGVFDKKIAFSGTWSVKDNEICMVNNVDGKAPDPKPIVGSTGRAGSRFLAYGALISMAPRSTKRTATDLKRKT